MPSERSAFLSVKQPIQSIHLCAIKQTIRRKGTCGCATDISSEHSYSRLSHSLEACYARTGCSTQMEGSL